MTQGIENQLLTEMKPDLHMQQRQIDEALNLAN